MRNVSRSHRPWFRAAPTARILPPLALVGAALALVAGVGCQSADEGGNNNVVDVTPSAISGENLAGSNLAGVNLAGSNLAGSNLAGANMGGANLAGSNLAGSNLAGTNLGGNNLAGSNLAGSNLAGSNLAGSNLAGSNLAGSNLAGSNLAGSNLAGSNLAGNNLAGSNLAGSNLAGADSGANIHTLTGTVKGMLYSREDLFLPKTGQCIVMGLGSTALPKLLGQQSANARMQVALGKLPWGFSTASGGSQTLSAWEAVVWGDKTYCVFLMVAPPTTNWMGVAGFIKAVFRWSAPPTQTIDIGGIEASAPVDPTMPTTMLTYTGMMNAGSQQRLGNVTSTNYLAGELAFITATTNNISVHVDFSSWVQDKNKNALVLGNVEAGTPPTYAEALYITLDNGDGTYSVILDDAASRSKFMPTGMTNSVVDLNAAYLAWQAGLGPKPVPRRCGGALYLNTWFGEPVPAGKCDNGLTWAPGFCIKGAAPWSSVAGTTAPMNSYMQLTSAGGGYQRALISGASCGTMKTVLSETYVHMWDRNYDIPFSATCVAETNSAFCARMGKNCGVLAGTDNCGITRSIASCGTCASPQTCTGSGVPNVCGNSNSAIYEAEALGNTLAGTSVSTSCPEAYNKVIGSNDPGMTVGACGGGAKIRNMGGSSSSYVTINNINAPAAGTYTLTVYAVSKDPRTFYLSANGGSATTVDLDGPDWTTPIAVTTSITLKAGINSLKLYNNSSMTPDLDRIKVTSTVAGVCTAETNAAFCARLVKNCGMATATDNCGVSRTVSSCGTCASPLTCGGGGEVNVCGSTASSICGGGFSQAACLAYKIGTVVQSGGHNYTCATANCMTCATYPTCVPGGTTCPFGVVWTDNGTCTANTAPPVACVTKYVQTSCINYLAGASVSRNGHNWKCVTGDCAHCITFPECEPGMTTCPWGGVWADTGTCF